MSLQPRKSPGAYDALKWARIDNARATGLDHLIGSLEPDKKGDIVMIDANGVSLAPCLDPIETVVGDADASNIEGVWVNGVPRKSDFRLTDPKASAAPSKMRAAGQAVLERAGRTELGTHRFTRG